MLIKFYFKIVAILVGHVDMWLSIQYSYTISFYKYKKVVNNLLECLNFIVYAAVRPYRYYKIDIHINNYWGLAIRYSQLFCYLYDNQNDLVLCTNCLDLFFKTSINSHLAFNFIYPMHYSCMIFSFKNICHFLKFKPKIFS